MRLLGAVDPQGEVGGSRVLADHEHLARVHDLHVGDRGIRDRGAAHRRRRHDHALRAGLHGDVGRRGRRAHEQRRDRETGGGERGASPGVSQLGLQ
jgi:hypothetical protein